MARGWSTCPILCGMKRFLLAGSIIAATPLAAQVPDTAIYQLSRPPITAADKERLRRGITVKSGPLTAADSATIKAIVAQWDPKRDTTVAPKIEGNGDAVQTVVTYPSGNVRYWARRSAKPPGWEFDVRSQVAIYRNQTPPRSGPKKASAKPELALTRADSLAVFAAARAYMAMASDTSATSFGVIGVRGDSLLVPTWINSEHIAMTEVRVLRRGTRWVAVSNEGLTVR